MSERMAGRTVIAERAFPVLRRAFDDSGLVITDEQIRVIIAVASGDWAKVALLRYLIVDRAFAVETTDDTPRIQSLELRHGTVVLQGWAVRPDSLHPHSFRAVVYDCENGFFKVLISDSRPGKLDMTRSRGSE